MIFEPDFITTEEMVTRAHEGVERLYKHLAKVDAIADPWTLVRLRAKTQFVENFVRELTIQVNENDTPEAAFTKANELLVTHWEKYGQGILPEILNDEQYAISQGLRGGYAFVAEENRRMKLTA